MQFSKTVDDVVAQVEKDDRGKWDAIVPCRELCLHGGRLVFPQAQEDGCEQGLVPTPWATSQMCQRLGIPAGYFKKCQPHLQDAQFNHWATTEEKAGNTSRSADEEEENGSSGSGGGIHSGHYWLLRAKGQVLRGAMSAKYAKLDNAKLLSILSPILEDARLKVALCQLSSESFHLRLVDSRLSRDVLPGDTHFVGIHIANSEVGKRAVSVDALVFRLVCTNGLIRLVKGKSLLSQRHLYLSEERFQARLGTAMREAVTVAAGFLERIENATRVPVPDVGGAIGALAEQWDLTQATTELVRFHLLAEPHTQQETLYGLTNAITAAAQRLPADDRYELEARAGALIERGEAPRNKAADIARKGDNGDRFATAAAMTAAISPAEESVANTAAAARAATAPAMPAP